MNRDRFRVRRNTVKPTGSSYQQYDGMKFKILRCLDPEEADIVDVGTMFEIELENGETIDVFEDEIFRYRAKDEYHRLLEDLVYN